jgi:excisionase family DNA binding protein
MTTQSATSCSQLPVFEPYVSADRAAQFLDVKRKTLLEKARKGEIPCHPWTGGRRNTWRFKLSELDDWMKSKVHSGHRPPLSNRRIQ